MIKLFLRLSFLIFAPLLFFVLSGTYSPITAINQGFIIDRVVSAFKGTFYLVEQELATTPPEKWQSHFKSISSDFVYEIFLISPEELDTFEALSDNTTALKALKRGEYLVVFPAEDEVDGLVKRTEQEGWYIYMKLAPNDDQAFLDTSSGTRNLLFNALNKIPEENWAKTIESLQPHFGYKLELINRAEFDQLSEKKDGQLEKDGIAWTETEDDEYELYIQSPNSKLILKAGPIAFPGETFHILLLIIGVLVTGISVGILMFVYPLWKDLKKLADSSAKFGQGHLTQRANIGKFSSIRQVASTFNTMADQIENMVKSQRELTNAIAHDLRTPLSRLTFAFEMLQSEDISKEERERYEKSIASGITTLDNLIQQILALSRYSRATDITHFGNHKLGEFIRNEVDLRITENPEKRFECNISNELVERSFFIDQRAMLRALGNLLTNALRYGNKTIIVSLIEQKDWLTLSVEDDGTGIPEQDRQNVFQPFKQLDNDQRESIKGHGLGLAIVQQIADWHDGEAYIETASIGGAKVAIKWPIKR